MPAGHSSPADKCCRLQAWRPASTTAPLVALRRYWADPTHPQPSGMSPASPRPRPTVSTAPAHGYPPAGYVFAKSHFLFGGQAAITPWLTSVSFIPQKCWAEQYTIGFHIILHTKWLPLLHCNNKNRVSLTESISNRKESFCLCLPQVCAPLLSLSMCLFWLARKKKCWHRWDQFSEPMSTVVWGGDAA